ncbi:hypothetical protein CONLIGDRAFT_355687 [Coniochaeta ligniaria NRRL 30616]|uniref:Uncharacterized protein n=1 Tax=Coniochaeta ligniaria NRRL 30616 TaxID=1408157 RepID=A0A1J7IS45_9PEZI|nr:hypothetical protein CONLIGDRAFT_355687 [Coniochaeta ligniaria NRRL 30616]
MVSYRFVVFAGLAAALPLNINLGAYSPALVVGDGEISFGGRTDVSNLINALEGAAVNAAAGATAGAAAAPAAAPATEAAAAAPAAQPEAVAAAATGDPALTEQASQISALQGMGKEIAPRVAEIDAPAVGKRDLAGFDRALTFAEAALTKGPKVQLGTGGEGSGVGIIVDNNPTAAARAGKGAEAGAAEGAVAAAAKRDVDEVSAPRRRAKVTTMYVRRGVPASLQASSEEIAARGPAPSVPESKVSKRSDTLDAVNLNVDGDAGLTLTFVEEVDDDEDED